MTIRYAIALALSCACGRQEVAPAPHAGGSAHTASAAQQVVGHERQEEMEAIAEREQEAPPATPTAGHPEALALFGHIDRTLVGDGGVDRIVWDESARANLVFAGRPYGMTDQFEVHAELALAGAQSPARFTIEALTCRVTAPPGGSAGTTRSFGVPLRWRDVSDVVARRPEGCLLVAEGIDPESIINDAPAVCPATSRAYVAIHCSHGYCLRFGLFDEVPPSESALARAASAARLEWVAPDQPPGPCD